MSKNILIISSSLRGGSNSEILAYEVLRGAEDAGNQAKLISLKDKTINFCKGCLACQKTENCIIRDDMNEMVEKVKNADVLIFVTPIYYYEMSGQLKTFLDRCNPLYVQDYKFRKVYLVATAAEDDESVSKKAVSGLNGWIDCFENASFAGHLTAGGVNDVNEAKSRNDYLKSAYEFGYKA